MSIYNVYKYKYINIHTVNIAENITNSFLILLLSFLFLYNLTDVRLLYRIFFTRIIERRDLCGEIWVL